MFNKIFAELTGKANEPERIMIDATHLKAHRRQLAKRGALPGCSGRTKGGLNSKLHTVCDGERRPIKLLLTAIKPQSPISLRPDALSPAPQDRERSRPHQGRASRRNTLRPVRPHFHVRILTFAPALASQGCTCQNRTTSYNAMSAYFVSIYLEAVAIKVGGPARHSIRCLPDLPANRTGCNNKFGKARLT